jgi:hypothetical protein
MRNAEGRGWAVVLLGAVGCATGGSAWVSEPLTERTEETRGAAFEPPRAAVPAPRPRRVHVIGGVREDVDEELPETPEGSITVGVSEGRVLGLFRNTYYDFPSEREHTGSAVALRDAGCGVIAEVPRSFHDAVCVQGSGLLARGQTVSFARRDCECAEICPRTGHRICFDALDTARFPWGRGALGKAITPLVTLAVDSSVIPMESAVYIPEYDGIAVDPDGTARHDGCFIAQDRGSRIQGKHVDIFTGHGITTQLWNKLVPSNRGVTVVLDSPRCARGQR